MGGISLTYCAKICTLWPFDLPYPWIFGGNLWCVHCVPTFTHLHSLTSLCQQIAHFISFHPFSSYSYNSISLPKVSKKKQMRLWPSLPPLSFPSLPFISSIRARSPLSKHKTSCDRSMPCLCRFPLAHLVRPSIDALFPLCLQKYLQIRKFFLFFFGRSPTIKTVVFFSIFSACQPPRLPAPSVHKSVHSPFSPNLHLWAGRSQSIYARVSVAYISAQSQHKREKMAERVGRMSGYYGKRVSDVDERV